MGYYLNSTGLRGLPAKNKAALITEDMDAILLPAAPNWSDVPDDSALICVVDQGPFEAAAFAYSKQEWEAFMQSGRPKTWILISDRAAVERLTGMTPRA